MQFLDLSLVCTIVTTVLPCKYICKPFDSLLLPLANLIGVNIVPGCDLYNRRSLSHCFTRYLCFELPRISVPLCFAHLGATSCQSYILHLIRLSDFRGPPLFITFYALTIILACRITANIKSDFSYAFTHLVDVPQGVEY